jgi:hypothetical protein
VLCRSPLVRAVPSVFFRGRFADPLYDLFVGSAVEGAASSVVELELTNTGVCAAAWEVTFPEQLVYAPEPWAANLSLTAEQTSKREVQSEKIFQVSPRKGMLQPGESGVVRLTYQHCRVADDRLTVFLQVEGKPELWLDLRGTTLPTGEGRCLTFCNVALHSASFFARGRSTQAGWLV